MYEKLRAKREELGYTQEDMAIELGYKSKNAYSLKERGARKFDIEEAQILAKKFGTTIEALFFGDEVTEMETKEDKVEKTLLSRHS